MPTGYIVPPVPMVAANATVEANAENATLTVANFGKIQTNTGADGISPTITNVDLQLPLAASVAGMALKIWITVANITVTLLPYAGTGSPVEGAESIYLGGDGVAGKYARIAGVVGNYLDLYSDGERYLITDYSGVVTKES